MLVHGGAGDVAAERVDAHVDGCRAAAQAAAEILRGGGSALDAVERAVVVLEDDPLFNAGTGACLNADGLIELDAAHHGGHAACAPAPCARCRRSCTRSRSRARVLEDGRHVLYAGEGAARFARRARLRAVDVARR